MSTNEPQQICECEHEENHHWPESNDEYKLRRCSILGCDCQRFTVMAQPEPQPVIAEPCEAESLIWLAACDVLPVESINALSGRVIEMRNVGYVPPRGALSRLGGFNRVEQPVSAKPENQFELCWHDIRRKDGLHCLRAENATLRELVRQVNGHGVATSYLTPELRAKLATIAS